MDWVWAMFHPQPARMPAIAPTISAFSADALPWRCALAVAEGDACHDWWCMS